MGININMPSHAGKPEIWQLLLKMEVTSGGCYIIWNGSCGLLLMTHPSPVSKQAIQFGGITALAGFQ